MNATGDEPTDEKMSFEQSILRDVEEIRARPGGHNDKQRELLEIQKRLEAVSLAMASSEFSERGDYARGWLNGVIKSLTYLTDLARSSLVPLD
jgi:hypothetical protein